MAQPSTIPQQLMTAAMLHFESGVPINDCHLDKRGWRDRLARVSHVYWIWKKNPFLDTFELFKQLVKNLSSDRHSAWHMAQKDQLLLDFVTQHVACDNRKVMEARVRASANHLMRMGMETDNAFALADGAKIAMKLDRLDQPESEQADMSKVMFLPPVVTTSAKEMDETKNDMDDAEMKRIMAKYNGYVDEKERDIEKMVETMEAKSGSEE
jgi:hypothetical protein